MFLYIGIVVGGIVAYMIARHFSGLSGSQLVGWTIAVVIFIGITAVGEGFDKKRAARKRWQKCRPPQPGPRHQSRRR